MNGDPLAGLAPFDMHGAGPRSAPIHHGRPRGAGWVRVADLANLSTGRLHGAVERMAERRHYPDRASRAAGFALITASAVASLAERCVSSTPLPRLRPASTWWLMSDWANVTAVAVEERATLEPTPRQLRAALVEALGPLYASLAGLLRFPEVAQWAQVASSLYLAALDRQPAGRRDAAALVDAACRDGATLERARPRLAWFDYAGDEHALVTRRVCCFNYRGQSDANCGAECPIPSPADRLACAIERLDDEASSSPIPLRQKGR